VTIPRPRRFEAGAQSHYNDLRYISGSNIS
jgi:hypothetical protein